MAGTPVTRSTARLERRLPRSKSSGYDCHVSECCDNRTVRLAAPTCIRLQRSARFQTKQTPMTDARDLFDAEVDPYYARLRESKDSDDRLEAVIALLAFVRGRWSDRDESWLVCGCAEVSALLFDVSTRGAAWLWIENELRTRGSPSRDSEVFQFTCLVPMIEEPVCWIDLGRLLSCGTSPGAAVCITETYRMIGLEERLIDDVKTCFAGDPRLLKELDYQYRTAVNED